MIRPLFRAGLCVDLVLSMFLFAPPEAVIGMVVCGAFLGGWWLRGQTG